MDGSGAGQQQKKKVISLKAIDATPANFKEYGQVVGASPDGARYGPLDAQLQLNLGTPRFYIMNLTGRALRFNSITHHASVTQCLGSVGGQQWYMGVASPSIVKTNESEGYEADSIRDVAKDNDGDDNSNESMKQFHQGGIFRSKAGHYYIPPSPEDVKVFRVQGSQFLKLNVGTWHAGPLFKDASMDFYNLELSDTNEVDHTTHVFSEKDGVGFVIEE
jgi:hypothetical protein